MVVANYLYLYLAIYVRSILFSGLPLKSTARFSIAFGFLPLIFAVKGEPSTSTVISVSPETSSLDCNLALTEHWRV